MSFTAFRLMEIFHLDVEVGIIIFRGQFSRIAHAIWVYADANHAGYSAVNRDYLKNRTQGFFKLQHCKHIFVKGEILGQLRS